jgi:hypothetical protein
MFVPNALVFGSGFRFRFHHAISMRCQPAAPRIDGPDSELETG